MSRFEAPSGALRPATLSLAGVVIAAVAVVAIATSNARSASAIQPTPPAASPVAAGSPIPSPVPTAVPQPSASPAPSAAPSADPTVDPETGGEDAMPIAVELITADGHAVNVDVVDHAGIVSTAVSGRPGDGASVDGFTLHVENVDADTLRLTWIDYPIDNRLALFVDEVDGHVRLALVQPAPTGTTDAIGFDRELLLSFDRAVDGATVEAILQDGLDTNG